MRTNGVNAFQLFLLWRHVSMQFVPTGLEEMHELTEDVQFTLPSAPGPTALFSADEIEVVLRLAKTLKAPWRAPAWRLLTRCVWERLFPDLFDRRIAGRLLKEAHEADNLVDWIKQVTAMESPYAMATQQLEELPAYREAAYPDAVMPFIPSMSLWGTS